MRNKIAQFNPAYPAGINRATTTRPTNHPGPDPLLALRPSHQVTAHLLTERANRNRIDLPDSRERPLTATPQDAEAREKLLARVRKLFAMAQEIEASSLEAEIALRHYQSLMTKFGIAERNLETSEFGRQSAHAGKRVPMHIQFLSIAVAKLHGVLFVNGGGEQAHFRGYDIDVRVARLTLDYLSDAVKREAEERASSSTGTALMIRKLEIVDRECGQDILITLIPGDLMNCPGAADQCHTALT